MVDKTYGTGVAHLRTEKNITDSGNAAEYPNSQVIISGEDYVIMRISNGVEWFSLGIGPSNRMPSASVLGKGSWKSDVIYLSDGVSYSPSSYIESIKVVDTINDLATIPSTYTTAIVKDSLRGGIFNWSATGTANTGTVFAGVTGFWNRQYSGALNAKWFGVISGGVINTQASMQAAWDYAFANACTLEIDKGKYLVDTITFPPALPAETRGNTFKVVGAGAGNVFMGTPPDNACTFIGSGNAPILRHVNRLAYVNTGAAWNISGIRFQANSSTPAVLLDMIGEYSYFGQCEIYQKGDGDGLEIGYLLKANIERMNIVNKHLLSPVGTVRVGAGVRVKSGASGGIPTLKKITSRGFLTGYILGENADSTHNMTALRLEQCESSIVGTGIDIRPGTVKAVIDTCYFEGIETAHIKDQGTATSITGCMHYNNAAANGVVYYDGNYVTIGNNFSGNFLEAASANTTFIKVNGNYNKIIRNNTLHCISGNTTGLTGIAIYGQSPSVDFGSNSFFPRGDWNGVGASKILKSYTENFIGTIRARNGSYLSCDKLVGSFDYVVGQSAITEADVIGNVLTLLDGVNYFNITPTVSISINQIVAVNEYPKELIFHVTNTNVTFTNSSYMKLAGGASYTGVGIITFLVENIAGTYYAYEKSRSLII